MGNRALITSVNKDLAIYLHWNGGRDSITAFLAYCNMREFRCPENSSYGYSRLCQVIANFMGSTLSVGISTFEFHDNYKYLDNGVYIIKDWQIVDRIDSPNIEQNNYDLLEMIIAINDKQPLSQQLAIEKIKEEFPKILVS